MHYLAQEEAKVLLKELVRISPVEEVDDGQVTKFWDYRIPGARIPPSLPPPPPLPRANEI